MLMSFRTNIVRCSSCHHILRGKAESELHVCGMVENFGPLDFDSDLAVGDAFNPKIGSDLVSSLVLLQRIGKGSYGTVFSAMDQFGSMFAVKVPMTRASQTEELTIMKELRVWEVPNIVYPVGVRLIDGAAYAQLYPLYSEKSPYHSADPRPLCLKQDGSADDPCLNQDGSFPQRFVWDAAVQLSVALAGMWAAGFIHWDVRKENVLWRKSDTPGRIDVHLADFGCVGPDDGPVRVTAATKGLPPNFNGVLQEADAYRLGLTLAALCGIYKPEGDMNWDLASVPTVELRTFIADLLDPKSENRAEVREFAEIHGLTAATRKPIDSIS
eukprot:GILI01027278.1.p1 GENE.GILI01027278.1~~GILI01027278.1.p1  ORF type:complete len:357 (+),score=32.26 GILI01027278.1:93-1073(+)